jgi:hypothetical protein
LNIEAMKVVFQAHNNGRRKQIVQRYKELITIGGENKSFKDTKINEELERQLSLLQYSSQIL